MAIPKPRAVTVGAGVVGVYEYGDPDGAPVFVFHGTPACGAGFAWADAPARERSLRLIAPDRPGVGLSSRLDSYTVADYPPMVAALADALGIERFAVWGYSGGGPYAAACAALLADRVTACRDRGRHGTDGRVGQAPKTSRRPIASCSGSRPSTRWSLACCSARTGRLARVAPKVAIKSFEKQLNESDRKTAATLGSPAETIALFTQAFLRGARGVVADYAALAQPWGVAGRGDPTSRRRCSTVTTTRWFRCATARSWSRASRTRS